jgi:8-oxo-dGTP pyrophosphatase MutT (NUDIX family)
MRLPVRVQRLGYQAAYAGLRVYSFFRRPHLRGVKCVLTEGDDVLLVRHTYGSRSWDLPGGAIKRGEDPAAAARREVSEELGVSVADWRALGELIMSIDYRNDRIHCFLAVAPTRAVTIDQVEIAEANWFPRGRLPDDLGRYARRILARLPATAG